MDASWAGSRPPCRAVRRAGRRACWSRGTGRRLWAGCSDRAARQTPWCASRVGHRPLSPFVAAVLDRFPGVDVRSGAAEELPFPDDTFDLSPRPAGRALHGRPRSRAEGDGSRHPSGRPGRRLRVGPRAWRFRSTDDLLAGRARPRSWAPDESGLAGAREGHLAELSEEAGLHEIEATTLTVTVHIASFSNWWDPFLLGVGPAGAYVTSLGDADRDALRDRCAQLLPSAPFDVDASAWCVRARI